METKECVNEKEENTCKDLPVTYCPKCKCFYMVDKEGSREEIIQLTETNEIIKAVKF